MLLGGEQRGGWGRGCPCGPRSGLPLAPPCNPKLTAPLAQEKGVEESHCPQHRARFPPAVLSPSSQPKHRPVPLHPSKHRAPPPGFGTRGSAQPRHPSRTSLAHPSPTFHPLCLSLPPHTARTMLVAGAPVPGVGGTAMWSHHGATGMSPPRRSHHNPYLGLGEVELAR